MGRGAGILVGCPPCFCFLVCLGFLGCPVTSSCGCRWILVWKGSAFPARSIPEVLDPVPAPAPLTEPSLDAHALIMHSRHTLTTNSRVQGIQNACPYPHSPSVPSVCALCCGTDFTLTPLPAAPSSACRHPITHHSLSPGLTVHLRGLPFPGRDFGAFLERLCLGSCKAALQNAAVPSQHSFSVSLEHSKAKPHQVGMCKSWQLLAPLQDPEDPQSCHTWDWDGTRVLKNQCG